MAKRPSLLRLTTALSLAALALAVSIVGYRMLRAQVAASVYRQRLLEVAQAYDALRARYNEAVRRTAVTELVVKAGRLSVRVRNAAGLIREIPTTYDPSGEIYVDFVALDGRLYIRRVFDARTPPSEGLTIDGSLAQIDWDAPGAEHGKAIYRKLGEGRWVISATGNGALTLSPTSEPIDLASAPPIRDYAELAEETAADVRAIGPRDVMDHVLGRD